MAVMPDTEETRRRAATVVAYGGVIAFRTDTFYGLGADPLNRSAVKRIRELKGREAEKPILLLISDISELDRFIVNKSIAFEAAARRHWPGPLTIVGIAVASLPGRLTAGTGTVGVRLPADEKVRTLVRSCGGALTATSANTSGNPPARAAKEVEAYFPTGLDLIIDSGETTATQPSTVVDLSSSEPRLIREGAIKRQELESLW